MISIETVQDKICGWKDWVGSPGRVDSSPFFSPNKLHAVSPEEGQASLLCIPPIKSSADKAVEQQETDQNILLANGKCFANEPSSSSMG